MREISASEVLEVAQRARPRLEAILNEPDMRSSLRAVGVRVLGELIPGYPKIVEAIQQHQREALALKNTFREYNGFFPDDRFRRVLKSEMKDAGRRFGDRDRLDALVAQKEQLDEIDLIETKAKQLIKADTMIIDAWKDAIAITAFAVPGQPRDFADAWGAGSNLTNRAADAVAVARFDQIEVTPRNPSPGRGI